MRTNMLAGIGLIWALSGVCPAADRDERVEVTPRIAPRQKAALASSIRLDVKLVLIPVTVTDTYGAPSLGLPSQAFRVFEDGVQQQLKYFATQDAPVSVGIVFDSSRSMEGKLDQSRAALAKFFQTATPGDEFFVVEFNDSPRLLCDFTDSPEQIERALTGIRPRNWTSLLDAVYLAIHHSKRSKNSRKALLILSDGGDNNSRFTEAEMKSLVREADVCIYSIGLTAGGLIKRHVRLLRQLSEDTGGRLCEVDKMSDLPDAVDKISSAMRNQYLLGYSSSNAANNGMYRKVEVKLGQELESRRLHVAWRTGYYAPAER